MDGVQVINGLECKIACNSSKVCNHLLLYIVKNYMPFVLKSPNFSKFLLRPFFVNAMHFAYFFMHLPIVFLNSHSLFSPLNTLLAVRFHMF
jgi:hypothetical protein